MGRSQSEERYCLRVELGCNPCGEPSKPPSKSHHHERKDRDGQERSHRSHSRHPSDRRAESPPLAIRQGTAPAKPAPTRHRSRHRSGSDARARSPTIQVIYPRAEEVTTSNSRRSGSVRRRDTASAHPEEATASRHRRSSSRSRREESPAEFHGWSPERRKGPSNYAESVSAPPPPSWPPTEQAYNPAQMPHRASATPPPSRRRHTSDTHTSRRAESLFAGRTHTDGAADAGNGDSRRDPRSFASRVAAAEKAAPRERESRRRDHDRPTAGDSGRRDAHHRREHVHDPYQAEGSMHYGVHVETFYASTDVPAAGAQYASYTFPPPQSHGNSYYQAYQGTTHPFTSGPAYEPVPPPPPPHWYSREYHSGTSSHNHRPSTSHGDYYSRPSSHRSGHEFPPGPNGGAYEQEVPPRDLAPYLAELGLRRDADDAAIRTAYKKLALKYHPDRLTGMDEKEKKKMEQRFVKIKEAHDILLEKN